MLQYDLCSHFAGGHVRFDTEQSIDTYSLFNIR